MGGYIYIYIYIYISFNLVCSYDDGSPHDADALQAFMLLCLCCFMFSFLLSMSSLGSIYLSNFLFISRRGFLPHELLPAL
jgi:hypothetical protein